MTNVQIGIIGKIVSGDEMGRFLKIVDDRVATGGFIILTADDLEFYCGYDNWVEDEAALRRYFQEAGWIVEW